MMGSPLGRGFLAGRYRSPDDLKEGDMRRMQPRFQGESFYLNLAVVDAVVRLPPSSLERQLIPLAFRTRLPRRRESRPLNWRWRTSWACRTRYVPSPYPHVYILTLFPAQVIPIPGSSSTARTLENIGAAGVAITPAEKAAIDEILNKVSFRFGGLN
jgi:aryl-alcohol dehydrogenase-like predicted oxidoreductase